MKFTRQDFARIRGGLLAVLLTALAGGGLLLYSLDRHRQAHQAQESASAQRVRFEGKLRQVRNEEQEIRRKADEFAALQARGVAGDERRLEWVELLRTLGEEHRLHDLRYEIAPRRRIDPAADTTLALHASTMRLEFTIRHEAAFLELLDTLRQRASAFVRVRQCSLTRQASATDGGNGAENPRTDNLRATCQLDWITLRPAADR